MSTQTETTIARLREMIMRGDFQAGEKLAEALLAQKLNVSRTPIRLALSELAKEGLLDYRSNRGFEVRSFSIDRIVDAVAVRENLEGFAAKQAATIGLSERHQKLLESCLLQIDGLLLKPELEHRDVRNWAEINGVFHRTIVEASGNEALIEFMDRFDTIPLAAAKTFAGTFDNLERQHSVIRKSQTEHRWVYEAIVAKDAARSEALMKQHVLEGRQNLGKMLRKLKEEADVQKHPILKLIA